MMWKKATTLLVVLCLGILGMPSTIGESVEPMSSITLSMNGFEYELSYEGMPFSKGEGAVSNVQYEEIGTEVLITYQTEDSARLAWSPDGEGFVDMVAYISGTPSEVGDYMKFIKPENFVTTGSGGKLGGTTKELELGMVLGNKGANGGKRYGQTEFKYAVWFMTGDGYDGNWVATMETYDHDWWNSGSTDFSNVYLWQDREEVEAPEFVSKMSPKPWRYTRLPYQGVNGWVFNGYTGYIENDASSWGWYREWGRNTQGTWRYGSQQIWDSLYKEWWTASNTGSNFQNTQTVSLRRMEDPRCLTLIYYITVIGYWGRRTNYSWHEKVWLQSPPGS